MRRTCPAGGAENLLRLASESFCRTNSAERIGKALLQAVPFSFYAAHSAADTPIVNLRQKTGNWRKKSCAAPADPVTDANRLDPDKIQKTTCLPHAVFYGAADCCTNV